MDFWEVSKMVFERSEKAILDTSQKSAKKVLSATKVKIGSRNSLL
jgi:hypothetical protein